MKKLLIILMAAMLSLSACTNKKSAEPENTTTVVHPDPDGERVTIDNLGLTYIVPSSWDEYKTTNIYPLTIQSEGTVARIIYNYINENDIEKISNILGTTSYKDYLTPFFEIMVAETKYFDDGTLDSLTSLYINKEIISTEGEYSYCVLYPYSDVKLEGEELEIFNRLTEDIPLLIASIETESFNAEDIKTVTETEAFNDYIMFSTHTLEGEEVDTSVFVDYDLTMINFWGTYALEKSNEQSTLQEVYEKCKEYELKKVNVINAIVDTPDVFNEMKVAEIKKEAGGEFMTIVLDETLANWVVNNLEGVPTTIFVNNQGKVIGSQIKGAKSADVYFNEIENIANSLENY